MTFATSLSSTAIRLIADKGQAEVFTRTTETGFDEATGLPVTTSETLTFTVAPMNYTASQIDGDSIRMSDVKLLASNEVEPKVGDKSATFGTVLHINKTLVQGQVIIYELHCRA